MSIVLGLFASACTIFTSLFCKHETCNCKSNCFSASNSERGNAEQQGSRSGEKSLTKPDPPDGDRNTGWSEDNSYLSTESMGHVVRRYELYEKHNREEHAKIWQAIKDEGPKCSNQADDFEDKTRTFHRGYHRLRDGVDGPRDDPGPRNASHQTKPRHRVVTFGRAYEQLK